MRLHLPANSQRFPLFIIDFHHQETFKVMLFYRVFQNPLVPKRDCLPHGPTRKKIFLVMRLTIILLIISLQLSAKGLSQEKISLNLKGASLESVLIAISKQTGYQYALQDQWKGVARKIDIDVTGASLSEVLEIAFKDQPFTYEIIKKIIVVKAREEERNESDGVNVGGTVEARGEVMNEEGQPMGGANVTVKETGRGTITNIKGEFVLRDVPVNGTLIISYIGYTKQLIKIKDAANVKVFLKVAKNELDKVVIQAYGTTTQRLNTGNITTVTAAEIERQPIMNPLLALEGKVPGVIVTPTSGYASAPISIEIRGRSVLDGGQPSEPLYIIDGVPLMVLNLDGSNYASGSSGFTQGITGPAGGQSPFFSVNPQDIESITVLKDADATAIYGSRGANGVIIINTKTGKAGKTKFDINIYDGASVVTGRYQLLNTQQYLMMRREAFKNDQTTIGLIPGETIPDASNAYDLLTWDTSRYTDWQKVYWDAMGHTTDVELSLSGGDKQNVFRVGGAYHKETSIMSRSGADQRGSVQFNYTHKSLDQRLNFSLTSAYSYTQSDLISVGGNVTEAPDAPTIFNSQGYLNWAGWQPVPYNVANWSPLFQPYDAKTGFLNSRLNVQYQILKGLNFSTQLGYSTVHGENMALTPIVSLNPQYNPKGSSGFSNTNITNSIVEPQLEYKGLIGIKGKLSVLTGASSQSVTSDASTASGSGYINDNLLRSVSNAPIKTASNAFGQYKYAALFARINYNWADKYLLNISARRDGSSRFGPGKQFGNFGAVGVGWIFTEEDWLKTHIPELSFGKLRASYGLTGNDQIGDYVYLTQWSASASIPYQGNPGYLPLQHANPNLEWETNYKLEGALDLGLFKDRITMEIARYRNRCGNQLVVFPLPYITGFGSVMQNSPALIQNGGWELLLKGKIIDGKDFSWSANLNFGTNRNKLVAYPNLAQSAYASAYTIGQSLSIKRLLHYTGVDPQTGQYTYEDKNHDGQINNSYNKGNNDTYNKDLAVQFDGGLGTDFRYKNLQLNLFFHFRKQELPSALYNGVPGNTEINQSIKVLNRWQKPGDHAEFARFTTQEQLSDQLLQASDGVYSDGSYFRLRNASLSYELPKSWIKKAGLQNCMIYARGQNLFILTRFNGIDPDVPGLGALPSPKVYTMGIQFGF